MTIPAEEYLDWRQNYLSFSHPNERMGQAFLNKYFPNVSDGELYYAENITQCDSIIYARYISH